MTSREHAESNYRRISLINWFIAVPLLILFGWPYAYLVTFVGLPRWFAYGGGFVFALPMIMTLIHGHVTMALGYAQRDYYYKWLLKNRRSHGLFFHSGAREKLHHRLLPARQKNTQFTPAQRLFSLAS